ncbi:MAG: type I-F CRISPR-associated protein Csy2 [Pseudomarimonas sp.]
MSTCPEFNHLLVLPRLRVQNANAISSPLTHGFPSMTAYLGLMWALERKAVAAGIDRIAFKAVGVVSHGWQEQTTEGGFVKAFRLTRNPIEKDGGTSAIVEEGRIHLDVSLVFALLAEDWGEDRRQSDVSAIADLVSTMRVAGGTVMPAERAWQRRYQPWLVNLTGDSDAQQKEFRKACVRLLPGSTLVARDDLIDQRLDALKNDNPSATRLDAWLSLSRVDWRHDADANAGKGAWHSNRKKGDGWIVPIPVGYGALSDLHPAGTVRNARDSSAPFRFVESLYSVGEWVGAHRLHSPKQLLWYADSRPDDGLYRCRNDYQPPADLLA